MVQHNFSSLRKLSEMSTKNSEKRCSPHRVKRGYRLDFRFEENNRRPNPSLFFAPIPHLHVCVEVPHNSNGIKCISLLPCVCEKACTRLKDSLFCRTTSAEQFSLELITTITNVPQAGEAHSQRLCKVASRLGSL